MRRPLAAAAVLILLVLASTGCAKETALNRFCRNYDVGSDLVTNNDHEDLEGYKAQYDRGVQSLAIAAEAAPTDIKVAVIRERDGAAAVNAKVQRADSMDGVFAAVFNDPRTDKAANADRISRWVDAHCDYNT